MKHTYEEGNYLLRLFAYFLDTYLFLWIVFPFFLYKDAHPYIKILAGTAFLSAEVFLFPINFLFLKFFEATPAKLLLGLRVRSADNGKLSNRQIISRELFAKSISIKTVIGILMVLFRKDGRPLHDVLAKTMVIKRDKLDVERTKINPSAISITLQGLVALMIFVLPLLGALIDIAMQRTK